VFFTPLLPVASQIHAGQYGLVFGDVRARFLDLREAFGIELLALVIKGAHLLLDNLHIHDDFVVVGRELHFFAQVDALGDNPLKYHQDTGGGLHRIN